VQGQRKSGRDISDAARIGSHTERIISRHEIVTLPSASSLAALRKEVRTLSTQIGETGTKLARRFGLEFAARAGANPIEHAAGGGQGGESRKSFEIPTDEHNLSAARLLTGGV